METVFGWLLALLIKTVLIPLSMTFSRWEICSEHGPMIRPSTCFRIKSSKYRSSRSGFQLVLQRKTVYPASTAASSIPCATSGKNGFVMSGIMSPIVFVSFFTKPWAMALGLYPISKAILTIRFFVSSEISG